MKTLCLLVALLCSPLLTGCAVIAVADTAASIVVGTVGLAADAAIGTVRLAGQAVGRLAEGLGGE